ncbi:MAG: DUF1549 domain-containing protein [Planctomycetales bacterium]|nr:DUF1549 domain-containing protein [Planctomycetales bacterium]
MCSYRKKILILFLSLWITCFTLANARAHEPLAPAYERFARDAVTEVPDFQRHVVPLLGRLGCNGRNCHGSFQGRGDFRLSLFGYDFEMDYQGLTHAASAGHALRVNRDSVANSLVLQKPTLQEDHEGGQRFRQDSWEYRLLKRWIESGASRSEQPQELASLDVQPNEALLQTDGQVIQLRVVATWTDGDQEDVTPLCRFRTNDDSVATVDEDGKVCSTGSGDTHIVAFYDNGIAALPVLRPRTSPDFLPTEVASETAPIDRFILTKLNKLQLTPSSQCNDTEFLRRVSIDLTGTLPTPSEVRQFLADARPDKRNVKIDELLQRPSYAAWWTNKLCDFTGCNPNQQAEMGQELSVQWYMWIFERLQENTPYDELIRRIVLAQSRNPGQSYDDYSRETSTYFQDDSVGEFAARETMPHYWTRRSMQEPARAGEAFAHNFLGIRLQCAQCHKHPFAPWTQADYQDFSHFFESVTFGVRPEEFDRYRELAKKVGLNVPNDKGAAIRVDALRQLDNETIIPWRELYIRNRDEPKLVKLLRSQVVELQGQADPRQPIMDWMSKPDNPWFARSFVNRVWATYFHRGIVDPPDDLNPANPPSHPLLLDWLAENFILHDFDMKWLHREIVSSQTYQRSWKPSSNNQDDFHNFSRSIPRRMPAEVVYDGVKQALESDEKAELVRTDLTRRATGHLSMRLAGTYAMQIFGKPERAVNCDCERNNQPTLLQAVFLQNDPIIEQRLEESGWLRDLASQAATRKTRDASQLARSHALLVEQAWLRVLSRLPSDQEIAHATAYLQQTETLVEGMQDLLWALMNTKEFLLIQ